jgi:hypothetical protein
MSKIDILHSIEKLTVLSVALLALTSCSCVSATIGEKQKSQIIPIPTPTMSAAALEACLNYQIGTPERIIKTKCELEQIFGVSFRYIQGDANVGTHIGDSGLEGYKDWLIPDPPTKQQKEQITGRLTQIVKYYSQFQGKNCLTIADIKNYMDYVGDETRLQIKPPSISTPPELCQFERLNDKFSETVGFLTTVQEGYDMPGNGINIQNVLLWPHDVFAPVISPALLLLENK